jgi:hypothetical protein
MSERTISLYKLCDKSPQGTEAMKFTGSAPFRPVGYLKAFAASWVGHKGKQSVFHGERFAYCSAHVRDQEHAQIWKVIVGTSG